MARQTLDQALLRIKSLERKGDLDAARELCQSLITQFPANQRLRQMLGKLGQARPKPAAVGQAPKAELEVMVAMFDQKQYGAVLKHGERLARRYPYSPVLFNIIASAAARLAKPDQAIEAYRRALELDPGFVDVLNNLGGLLKVEKRNDEAIDCYLRSLRIRPDQPGVLRNLAEAESVLERRDDAIEHFRAALKLRPDDVEALNGLSVALMESERLDEALEAARQGMEIAPEDAGVRLAYAQILRLQGKIEEATAAYKALLAMKPGHPIGYRGLSQIHRFTPDDPLMKEIEHYHETADGEFSDRWHLAFALAKAHEDLGHYKEAFEALEEANRLQRGRTGYTIERDIRLFDALRANAPVLARWALPAGITPVETMPVFIVAMPRSGTSLTEQIISSHSMVRGGGELNDLDLLGLDVATGAKPVSTSVLRGIRADYLAKVRSRAGGAPYLTDKMPHNFRQVALIRAILPEAKIVHVHRDPAAVCWSNFKQIFNSKGLNYTNDLGDIVKFYNLYTDLMGFWKSLFGDAVYTLDYDRLTVDQEDETRKLIAYLGLPWEEACLAPHRNRRGVRTASEQQVKKAVYKGSSQEWRKFEPYIGDVFDALPT